MRTLLIAGAVGLVLSWQQNAHATCVPECIDDGWSTIAPDTTDPMAGHRRNMRQYDRPYVDVPNNGKLMQEQYDSRVDAINEFNSRQGR